MTLILLVSLGLLAQTGGVSTPIRSGTSLPSGAAINSMFIVNGTGLYKCNVNPCTTAANWTKMAEVDATGKLTVTSIQATTVAVGTTVSSPIYTVVTPLTADAACTSGVYWLAPIAGSTNAWRECTNGTLATIAPYSLPTNVTTQNNTFNGNSQLVQTTAAGKLPAIDGSLLTNVPSGTHAQNDYTGLTVTQWAFGASNIGTLTASALLYPLIPTAMAYTLPANDVTTVPASQGQLILGILPAANWVATLQRYPAATAGCQTSTPVTVGTVTISTTGAQTWSTTATAFAIGDCLGVEAPATVDTVAQMQPASGVQISNLVFAVVK
jgi:hypothetical protein